MVLFFFKDILRTRLERPYRSVPDAFQSLRRQWFQIMLKKDMIGKLQSFFVSGENRPPFCENDLQPFRDTISSFIQSHGLTLDWTIRDDQPMHLSIMAALASILRDKDTTLAPMLMKVPQLDSVVIFPLLPVDDKSDSSIPLSIHMTNWQSA